MQLERAMNRQIVIDKKNLINFFTRCLRVTYAKPFEIIINMYPMKMKLNLHIARVFDPVNFKMGFLSHSKTFNRNFNFSVKFFSLQITPRDLKQYMIGKKNLI